MSVLWLLSGTDMATTLGWSSSDGLPVLVADADEIVQEPWLVNWSSYDPAQSQLNDALIATFGETVEFNPTGYQYSVQAIFEVTGPENTGSRSRDVQDIGNTESYRPRPYLLMRTKDVVGLDIQARQRVIVRSNYMTVVSDPIDDGQGMTIVYVRGEF